MSNNIEKSKDYMKEIFSYMTLVAGAMIAAFSIEEFLVPCTILDGGIVGISIMINNLSKIPLGVLTMGLNIPFLIMGMRKLGVKSKRQMLRRLSPSVMCRRLSEITLKRERMKMCKQITG